MLDSDALVLDPSFDAVHVDGDAFIDFFIYLVDHIIQSKATDTFGILCENGKWK